MSQNLGENDTPAQGRSTSLPQYLMRISKAAVASVVQKSNARWKVMLQDSGAAVAASATRIKLAVVSSSMLPSSSRAL